MNSFLLVIILNSAIQVSCIFTGTVQIDQGTLRGLRSVSGQNRYYGITYAVSKRFQPPREPPSWSGVFFAVRRFTTCAQSVSILTMGTEDCLQLDVYTPESARPNDRIPVMMFIHGGGYYYGSKFHYDPEFLVTKNIIAVIVNYRVGVLGFLCIDDVANLGLKDQLAALRWIRRNIAAFGGDPDNVTLCGQSAGASSAAMHLLSRASKGLFHKAILLSGSPLTPWAFNVENLTPALEDAAKLSPVKNTADVLKVFSEATLGDLLKVTHDTSINTRYFKYSPCVDTNTSQPFFHDLPYDAIASGDFNKVPIIIGHADVEGILFNGLHNDMTIQDLLKDLPQKIPSVFSVCSEDVKSSIAEQLRSYHFPMSMANSQGLVDYYSDWIAYSSIYAFSALVTQVSNVPVYNYIFSYEGDRNFAKFLFGSNYKTRGASHSDDIFYIFKPGGISMILSKQDRLLINRWTKMLVTFMWTSNPTPRKTKMIPLKWPRFSKNSSSVLKVSKKFTTTVLRESHRGRIMFDLLCAYGKKGYVPCNGKGLCEQ